ncbi:hypothetical protein [Okeania sp.]|uniref:hypothetical protein n=1 Tax=Okeania sp. TaxID=3100323 RepID=UPI002B4B69DC|nr:hypothetical protein [Okeania sp.]MEB3341882.1 hypothetical protein [Okeania sp.]
MAKGFGVSNSGSKKKKNKSGKFFSELPEEKQVTEVKEGCKYIEEDSYFILKVDNLNTFDFNNIWGDDDLYIPGIEGFDGFSENGLVYSDNEFYSFCIEENLGAEYTLRMAKYLTMKTQKSHVVIGILANGKDEFTGKYEYDEELKKQHQILLDVFGKMPEYNEYVNYIDEPLNKEIKKLSRYFS